jgi:acetyl esterase/lipase
MSAVFALMNKERGGVDRRAPVLVHPVADADFDTPSSLQFAEGYYLTRDGMKWFWDAYTTDDAQRTEVYASPLHASLDQLRGRDGGWTLHARPRRMPAWPARQSETAEGDMQMTKALFVVSAADHWTLNDGTEHPSGF